ncbi:hypothetical protein [Novosphingobium sp.]|uniref:hypothetical protein n=1 Tax=Novosphingobium sp. TaxID=1874826 RepID=UPI002732A74B|nr:hypothetical protein [Novosphingobium sp.]MDP3906445.1 hypothetical protein [Novosphingobium sp.]
MEINELSDRQIDVFIDNYKAYGKETGGKFPLSELLLEKKRRIVSPFPPERTAKTIVRLAKNSHDGFVTYKEVWQNFRPDKVWTGNAPRAEIANALGRVIAYCIDNKLPIISTLVVRSSTRNHSDEAVSNIYNEAKALGADVGHDAIAFVKSQQEQARLLTAHWASESG